MENSPQIGHDWYHHHMGPTLDGVPYFGKLWVCRRCGSKVNFGDETVVPSHLLQMPGELTCEEEQLHQVHNQ